MTSAIKIAAIAAVSALPYSVMSAPTITFEGEITAQTCSVNINGQTNSVVLLPTVAEGEFGAPLANGQTAGLTPFTISLTGCTASASPTNIATQFLGYDVNATTGTLGNRATTNAARGYGIQLMSAATGGAAVMLSGLTSVAGLVLPANATSTSYDFGAQYYVVDASTAAAGKISAVAEYTVSYL